MRVRSALAALVTSVLLLLLQLPCGAAMAFNATFLYKMGEKGVAEVLVIISDCEEELVEVPVDPGVLRESVIASSADGSPLPFDVGEGVVVVYVDDVSGPIVIAYAAIVGEEEEGGLVKAVISPAGRAVVYLPEGAALLGVNASAAVSVSGNTIVLSFDAPGTYEIRYLVAVSEGQRVQPITTAVLGVALVALASITAWWLLARRRQATEAAGGGLDDRDQAIVELLRREGALTVSEISRRLGLSKSTVHRRLSRLVKMGYVEREVKNGLVLYKAKD